MGIVIRQSFYNTINSYVGVALGALNTMILFPRLFPEDPSFMGEVQTILAGATVYGSFGHLGLA
ncbi:MAG: lipopolysaccharide biosynthesis protein, partial [Schleiferiaceae bacterium]|nr:lipopolysaccharide biosynthesis protein [Schleiferiaceae bacterium]